MGKLLFDSHAHINEESYTDAERAELIREIEASELAYVIDIGYDIKSSERAVKHAQAYEWCYATVGIHPLHIGHGFWDYAQNDKTRHQNDRGCHQDVKTSHPSQAISYDDTACHPVRSEAESQDPLITITCIAKSIGVKAIGEIGLDYRDPDIDKALQQEVFRRQIHLAKELDLPIVIHQVAAYEDTLKILKDEKAFNGAGVMLHCFSGSAQQAQECAKLGAMISIGGPVTWVGNRKATEPAKVVPIENLLIETDSPFLTPEPFCNKKNSPVLLEYIAKKIADLRGISYEELAESTLNNGVRFYGIG